MLITCPSCASAYDLPFDRIGDAGRKVRCASCRESWFVAVPVEKPSLDIEPDLTFDFNAVARTMPAAPVAAAPVVATGPDEPAALPLPSAAPSTSARRATPPKRRGKAKRAQGSIVGSLRRAAAAAAIVLGLPALLLMRAEIVAALPGTASIYAALGLPVNLVGLRLAGIRSVLTEENGTPVLEVSGDITNVGRTPRAVPPLLLSIEGESGEGLYAWSARAAEGDLDVGRTVPFRVRLTAPPPASKRVEVTFKDLRKDPRTRSALASIR